MCVSRNISPGKPLQEFSGGRNLLSWSVRKEGGAYEQGHGIFLSLCYL